MSFRFDKQWVKGKTRFIAIYRKCNPVMLSNIVCSKLGGFPVFQGENSILGKSMQGHFFPRRCII